MNFRRAFAVVGVGCAEKLIPVTRKAGRLVFREILKATHDTTKDDE
jgi:hypothetical protein